MPTNEKLTISEIASRIYTSLPPEMKVGEELEYDSLKVYVKRVLRENNLSLSPGYVSSILGFITTKHEGVLSAKG